MSQSIPIIILPLDTILFPLQTINNLVISPPHSIQLTKSFLAAQHPIYIGCVPLKHNSNNNQHQQQQQQQQHPSNNTDQSSLGTTYQSSNSPQNAFQWGTIARLVSFDHSTATHSLKINLMGIHRFKIIRYLPPSETTAQNTWAQVIKFEENPLQPSTTLLEKFKHAITRFIVLLAHSFQPNPTQPDPNAQINRLVESFQTDQLSFLIDLMIRDIQLIPWQHKLDFLTYVNPQVKLEKFILLITNISDQIQAFYAQSNFFRAPTASYHPPASTDLSKLPDPSNLSIQQKDLLIRSRLKAINSQLALGIQQLNQLHYNNDHPATNDKTFQSYPPHLKPNSRPMPRTIIFAHPRRSGPFGNPFGNMDSEEDDELKEIEKKIQSAGMTQEAFQICCKELKRLRSIQPSSVEHSVIKNYLEIMLELPWSKSSINLTNQAVLAKGFLQKARAQLDLDHFGMLQVKQRLIEFLAVIKLRTDVDIRAANQQFVPSNVDPSKNNNSSTKSSIEAPQKPNESQISRLWKDNVDPTFLIQTDRSPDHPTGSLDHTKLPTVSSEKKRAPILLLVGPPGVGKTSVAKSIAKAMNKKFYRISLGGVKDESEIRGHRRTYVGSMPGTIVQALRRVGVNDPVILLDEIDKVGSRSINGDPASALLEVLDPEQNSAFVDHYINTPIDLSSVLFLATANSTSTISPPLLDRLEVIQVDGYSLDEKISIAKRNLIPKQIKNYSLQPHQFILDDDEILKKIILSYTSESGVRGLEREIGSLCRAKVLEYIQGRDQPDVVDQKTKPDQDHLGQFSAKISLEDVHRILGPEQFEMEVSNMKLKPGVAIGMAYQGSGNGSILYIEAASYPGKGGLKLTGSLGDVIKESAELAISWIKSNSNLMNLNLSKLDGSDVHIHFPSGSIKKDGPSAGVGLVLALVSLFSDLPIDNTLAVTGEISLRGQILPVGGIKEKVLAASRSGIKRIIMPARNEKEVESDENLKKVKASLEVHYVRSLYEVIKLAFKDELWTGVRDTDSSPEPLAGHTSPRHRGNTPHQDHHLVINHHRQQLDRLVGRGSDSYL